ncbi:replicative DNA helicase [Candidatus Nitrosacidococcus tergens]|uniref:Replicative DNA helicase n=1 Tax=Candidatus Nitrosacidococcus tergens TaxID=553981 RepID=A0A7G1Q7C9_9GAMM|nr:replicative DNA helicase [Candidatus Nitrosacidococcus tergens]CAB1274417.1 replicative DNA helicase [Candidatus Nitrosacidococcus tergens]
MGEISKFIYQEQEDRSFHSLKIPPHSIEAEQSVLGGLLLDNQAWDHIGDILKPDDFYKSEHTILFDGINRLIETSQPCDAITLSEYLRGQQTLEKVGGLPYIVALVQNTPTAANIKAYADVVRERSILRQIIHIGTEVAQSGYFPEGRGSKELLDEAEQRIFAIAEQGNRVRQSFFDIKALLTKAVDRIAYLHEQDNPIIGVPSGFVDFDALTSGFGKGDLVIIAGRPSMGKTSFAMNIAEYAAVKQHLSIAIFSMEMPADQLVMRMMSSTGRIDQGRVRTGRLRDEDWPKLTIAIKSLNEAPIFIDDTPALSPSELRARIRRLIREQGNLGLILIDYLQLMQIPGSKENRATEISEISRNLKVIAKEFNVPVLALSQLNRSLEGRPSKKPVMSDLRESGAIEQDADLIIFIYRDEVYNEDSPEKGTAEIIIGKQRNGPIGTVRLTFRGEYTRFENYTQDPYE